MVEQQNISSSQESNELDTLDIGSPDLDMFGICKRNTRKRSFIQLTKKMITQPMRALPQISEQVLEQFLGQIWQGYRDFNPSYHNDMHGLDVAQMTYILLETGSDCLYQQLELGPIDRMALIIAAVCHDFRHDGFNNGYHVATHSARFETHGSEGVQEKFHFADSYKIVEQSKLLAGLNPENKQLFKRRMMLCILATDMARHMKDLNEIKLICEELDEGASILSNELPADEVENRRDKFLELVVHASDISFLSRPKKVQ